MFLGIHIDERKEEARWERKSHRLSGPSCLLIQLPVTPQLGHLGSVPREIKFSFTQLALPCCMSPDNSWAPGPALTPPSPQLISQSWVGGLWGLAGDRDILFIGLCL